MTRFRPPTKEQISRMKALYSRHELPDDVEIDPRVEKLVEDLIGCVADKWTMLILETLVGSGTLRFTQLSKLIGGISQKMLTQTVGEWSATAFWPARYIRWCRRRWNTSSRISVLHSVPPSAECGCGRLKISQRSRNRAPNSTRRRQRRSRN